MEKMISKIDSLSVFLPAYNEEKNIINTIKNVKESLEDIMIKNYEIIVVNDGSSDRTKALVEEYIIKQSFSASKNGYVRLINHLQNLGYGSALKTGFREAKYPWVAFIDSDGQFDFHEIKEFLSKVDEADLILGYRLKRADSFSRRLFTLGWSMIAKILLGLSVKDYSCAFKLVKKEVFDAVLPLKSEEKVTQIEFLVKAKRKGFRFAEVGVHHYPRKFGEQTGANLKVVFKSVFDLLKLKWQIG